MDEKDINPLTSSCSLAGEVWLVPFSECSLFIIVNCIRYCWEGSIMMPLILNTANQLDLLQRNERRKRPAAMRKMKMNPMCFVCNNIRAIFPVIVCWLHQVNYNKILSWFNKLASDWVKLKRLTDRPSTAEKKVANWIFLPKYIAKKKSGRKIRSK